MTSTSPFMAGLRGAEEKGRRSGPESGSLRGGLLGIKLAAVEHLAGAGLAGSAAGGHAGARLELLEGPCALEDGLLQSGFADAVADADVHGCTSVSGRILCRELAECK